MTKDIVKANQNRIFTALAIIALCPVIYMWLNGSFFLTLLGWFAWLSLGVIVVGKSFSMKALGDKELTTSQAFKYAGLIVAWPLALLIGK